ncbi:Lysophospholipase L1 [Cyclobacterium lianum]|uniref:Lysophospholipase L1 n=1 Tax=Cyclobacterium lianum TaxID=388280 RepID=A0A1M7N5S3_9BACT|nr:sialate O-acetylesterase [Cyclobacterium lianum]SHM98380.1 Lysophospholipase L1 [Cyclobacterium lianum]
MKYIANFPGILILSLSLLSMPVAAQKELDLFIWAGQSNAQGWMGDAANYPQEGKELDDAILLNWTFVDNESSKGAWVSMQPQDGRFPKGHFGPEVSFARELKKAGYNPAIFKYTKGATGLARDWKAPGEGGIYDRMTEDLKSAIKRLEQDGYQVTLRGFIWIQGETDAAEEDSAREYQTNLNKMIQDLRQNQVNEPNLKIILGVDEQHPFVRERPEVVAAQKKLAAEDSTIAFTSMKGLPKADATHLTPEGLVAHGKRIFGAYASVSVSAENYHQQRKGIRNSLIRFQREKKARVAFLGGSITYNGGWRDSISSYLQQRFPHTEFEFIAAGIPSMGSTPAAFRLERDVTGGGAVDLLFVEAAVNDAANGRSSGEQIRAMEGIVRHMRQHHPASDIILMHFADPGKVDQYRSGQLPDVIKNHEKVAAHYELGTINLAKEVTERIDAGEFSWEADFKDLHPSPFGQGVYFQSMKVFLGNAWSSAVDENEKIQLYDLPEPIDPANYDNGVLIDPKMAKAGPDWQLVTNWKPEDGAATRPNYVNVPMLVASKAGAALVFDFSGNAVGIAVAAGPDVGIIEYRIDNKGWQKLDLFTRWSTQLHLPWYYTLAAGLSKGEHVLELRTTAEKNIQSSGTACRIRYLYINR